MKIVKKAKYGIAIVAGVCVLTLFTAAYKSDFKLGQNVELIVNMMRNIFLYYVDDVDPDKLGKNAAAGMVRDLDPYTELIHADDMAGFELMTTGKYGGIGSIIRQRDEYVQIAEPYKGSPADRAGLRIGDTFIEINGKSAKGLTTSDVSELLKGEAGTSVKIKIRKFYTGQVESLTIRREVIALPAIPYFGMVSDSVGYIHHSDFTDGCSDEMRMAFTDLKSQGAKGIILDYRENGGGIMQEAVKIISMFVPKGTEVVSMRGRGEGMNKQYFTASEPLDTEMPLAVLVGGHSASAAEIVAGALQDFDRAVLIGQRTFGKGLVQNTLPVGFNSFIKITTAKYYIPSGRCIQAINYSNSSETGGVGFIPDSLIKEFHTAGGRKVYDGRGVMPDIRLKPEYISRFAMIAYGKGYIDEFVDQWCLANREIDTSPQIFAMTDENYMSFTEFVKNKDFEYESGTKQAIRELRKNAEQERYLDEIRDYIDKIETSLKDDNETNLRLYRDELTKIIENGIILRSHYLEGVTKHSIPSDKGIMEAISVLHTPERYKEIVISKDTDRK